MIKRKGRKFPAEIHKDFQLGLNFSPAVLTAIALAQLGLCSLPVEIAQAADAQRLFQNPPTVEARRKPLAKSKLMALPPSETPAGAMEKELDLDIVYTTSTLYNPATDRYDDVKLRSYVGTDTNPDRPFVAPLIDVSPGDTVRITLNNKLPTYGSNNNPTSFDPNSSCAANSDHNIDIPHCLNTTNLHTHGLWVSPAGNSDNVLLSIDPGKQFQFEYNIPPDHPAGTFWYHPHQHGSTALQVASGMAGALIVRGNRLPTEAANGDIDTLLSGMTENVLVFQQIQYGCLGADGKIKVRTDPPNQDPNDPKYNVVAWPCETNETGVIESYDNFGPGTWPESDRYTSINGLIMPMFTAQAGEIQRWRMVHAGVRETITVQFKKMKDGAKHFKGKDADEAPKFVAENCVGEPVPFHAIAEDGLTRAQALQTDRTVLQPGYRTDALVVFPDQGKYCMIDMPTSEASGSPTQGAEAARVLGYVEVKPGKAVSDIHGHVTKHLVRAAEKTISGSVRSQIVNDLKADLKFTKFVPHPEVTDQEIADSIKLGAKQQDLVYHIYVDGPDAPYWPKDHSPIPEGQDATPDFPNAPKFLVSNQLGSNFTLAPYVGVRPPDPKNLQPFFNYKADRIDRRFILGTAEEWRLQAYLVSHPFHIHINPFQIVKILDPEGKDVSPPDAVDDFVPPGNTKLLGDGPKIDSTPDPQYRGLKGVWKDTLWVKSLFDVPDATDKPGLYTIILRTRYERYIGQYVQHCHILDHEDQGMMQNLEVVLPANRPGDGH